MLSPENICKVICMDDDESEIKKCLENNPDGCKVLKAGKELFKDQEAETRKDTLDFICNRYSYKECISCDGNRFFNRCFRLIEDNDCPAWQAVKGV